MVDESFSYRSRHSGLHPKRSRYTPHPYPFLVSTQELVVNLKLSCQAANYYPQTIPFNSRTGNAKQTNSDTCTPSRGTTLNSSRYCSRVRAKLFPSGASQTLTELSPKRGFSGLNQVTSKRVFLERLLSCLCLRAPLGWSHLCPLSVFSLPNEVLHLKLCEPFHSPISDCVNENRYKWMNGSQPWGQFIESNILNFFSAFSKWIQTETEVDGRIPGIYIADLHRRDSPNRTTKKPPLAIEDRVEMACLSRFSTHGSTDAFQKRNFNSRRSKCNDCRQPHSKRSHLTEPHSTTSLIVERCRRHHIVVKGQAKIQQL